MEIIKINCNSCGAGLQIPDKVEFFNCSFCGSQLKMVKSAGAQFTEVVGELVEHTEAISQNTNIIQLEKAIERLDRDWERRKEQLGLEEHDGSNRQVAITIMGGVASLAFIIFWINGASSMSSHFDDPMAKVFPLFGVAMLVIVLINMLSTPQKLSSFQKAKQQYEEKRRELLTELQQARRE